MTAILACIVTASAGIAVDDWRGKVAVVSLLVIVACFWIFARYRGH